MKFGSLSVILVQTKSLNKHLYRMMYTFDWTTRICSPTDYCAGTKPALFYLYLLLLQTYALVLNAIFSDIHELKEKKISSCDWYPQHIQAKPFVYQRWWTGKAFGTSQETTTQNLTAVQAEWCEYEIDFVIATPRMYLLHQILIPECQYSCCLELFRMTVLWRVCMFLKF